MSTPIRGRPWGVRKALVLGAALVALGVGLGPGCGPQPDQIIPDPTAAAKGLVLDPQRVRVAGALVQLEGPRTFSRITLSDGTYVIDNVVPDLYDVVASRLIGTTVLRARLRFARLLPGQTLLVPDLVLANPGAIRGRVILQGSTTSGGVLVTVIGTSRSATTADDGTFTITDLEEGVYALNLSRQGFIDETVSAIPVAAGIGTVVADVTLRPLNPSPVVTISGRVLLESRTDNSGVTVIVDGTSRSTLTTSGGFFTFAGLPISTYTISLSRTDFFTRRIGPVGVTPGQTSIQLANVQLDSHRAMNTTVRAFELTFNPEGSQIAYVTSDNPALGEIALTDRTASIFQRVLTTGARATAFSGLAWSPDANDILFIRSFASPANTSTIGAVTSSGRDLHDLFPVANQFLMPAWSPDNSAFVFYQNPVLRTVSVDRSTGSLRATTSTSRVVDTIGTVQLLTGIEWSNTGRIVYSFSIPAGTGVVSQGIFSIFSTGGGRLSIIPRLTDGRTIPSPESPAFNPQFTRLAFSFRDATAATPPNGIYLMDLDGTNATQITTQPGNNLDWAPDGSRIIYTALATDRLAHRIHEVLVPR